MNKGITWDRKGLPLLVAIQQAADYYWHTFEHGPELVMLPIGTEIPQELAITARCMPGIAADHIWIGEELRLVEQP